MIKKERLARRFDPPRGFDDFVLSLSMTTPLIMPVHDWVLIDLVIATGLEPTTT